MKKTNIFAAATAMVMALASLPVVSASADGTFAPGDVDMDGVITGHDSAVVSRALYEEDASLTAEQIALADVNGDGVVDQTDLEWIHGQEEYAIGDTRMENKEHLDPFDAYYILMLDSLKRAGCNIEFSDSAKVFTGKDIDTIVSELSQNPALGKTISISQVQYNLFDVDGDNDVDINDAHETMMAVSWQSAGCPAIAEGRYDLLAQPYYVAWSLEHYGFSVFEHVYD